MSFTICLNMIVKNESNIIKRMFDSVLDIIDTYCICDTGSTDNTIEIIEKYFKEKGKKGIVIKELFKNFEYNRTFALQKCYGMSDFILVMDADMMLETRNDFKKDILDKNTVYSIYQGNNDFYYLNIRLVPNVKDIFYKGVTHEYISIPNQYKREMIKKEDLFIRDIGDGGCKENKIKRDIELLEKGIQEEPTNGRYYFYVANTYMDGNFYEKAIETYKKRIHLGGWSEELWYSSYKIGLSYLRLHEKEKAVYFFLDCIRYNPNRIENIYEIVKMYRIHGNHELGYYFYNIAKNTMKDGNSYENCLFFHNNIYEYELDYEYSILAYYIGERSIDKIIHNIMNKTTIYHDSLLRNLKFYQQYFQEKRKIEIRNPKEIECKQNKIKIYPSSSSIIPYKDGYFMNIRYVNYQIDEKGRYLNCEKNIISMNYKFMIDTNFQEMKEIGVIKNDENDNYYQGIEDLKIFNCNDNIHFIGTHITKDRSIGICSGIYNIEGENLKYKRIKNRKSCEKNWVYVSIKNELYIIYQWFPLQIGKLNEDKLVLLKDIEMPLYFKNTRGSSCGFEYKNEIWFIIHTVSYEEPRNYFHSIVVFDTDLNLKRYTPYMKFQSRRIEYCLSIMIKEDEIIIPYSIWDNQSVLSIYDKKYIESFMIIHE